MGMKVSASDIRTPMPWGPSLRAQRGNLLLVLPGGNRPVGQNGWIALADTVGLAMTVSGTLGAMTTSHTWCVC